MPDTFKAEDIAHYDEPFGPWRVCDSVLLL